MEDQKKLGSTDLFMLLAVLIWAFNFSFLKIALREFSPLGFNGIRLVFASLVALLILFFSKEGLFLTRSFFWKLFFLGIVGNTIFQLLFIHGLNWTTASNTSIVMAMTPVFVALLSSLARQERIHWAAWGGILISLIGFYFVITKQAGTFHYSWQSLRGDLMIFAGNLCWAIYTVYSRPLLEKISPLKLTAVTMAIGTVFFLPFCMGDIFRLRPAEISFKAWVLLFYSGLFALVVSYLIWYYSVKRVGNSKTAIYGNITPIFTVLLAYIFLAERLSFLQVAGALIIFIGVYLTRLGYRFFDNRSSK